MKRGFTLRCGPALNYTVDLLIQKYTEPVPLNMENSPQNIRRYTDTFLQCTGNTGAVRLRRVTSTVAVYVHVLQQHTMLA